MSRIFWRVEDLHAVCSVSQPETKAGEACFPHQQKGSSATPDYLHVTMT